MKRNMQCIPVFWGSVNKSGAVSRRNLCNCSSLNTRASLKITVGLRIKSHVYTQKIVKHKVKRTPQIHLTCPDRVAAQGLDLKDSGLSSTRTAMESRAHKEQA